MAGRQPGAAEGEQGRRARRPAAARRRALAGLAVAAAALAAPHPAPAAAAVRDPARFACPPGLTTPFTDVAGSVHQQAIACAVHHQLTGGTSPTTYGPAQPVTRGQLATFVARLLRTDSLGVPPAPPAGFADTAGSPHERSIDAVVALGVATGTSPTTFSPDQPVTRAQLATVLARTLEVLGADLPAELPDAFADDEGSTHERGIDALAALGIAAGTAPGRFSPGAPVDRGAAASFLVRLIDHGIEHGLLPPNVQLDAFAALPGGGTAVLSTTDVPGVLCFEVVLAGGTGTVPAAVHLGDADAGRGPAVVTLPRLRAGGFTGGCVSDPDADRVGADPGAAYLEVGGPAGAVRAQLGERAVGAVGDLAAVQVVPGPGDRDAFGIVAVFTTTQPGVVCASAAVFSRSAPTAVHLHRAPPHANGPVAVDLGPVEPFGVSIACRRAGEVAGAFAADPGAFYVDVHTASHPDGALRGQLEPTG